VEGYNVGERVRIRGMILCRHVGRTGHIVAVKPAVKGEPSLYKYTVALAPDLTSEEFWGIQLEKPIDLRCAPSEGM
jgi:hypothetical protein